MHYDQSLSYFKSVYLKLLKYISSKNTSMWFLPINTFLFLNTFAVNTKNFIGQITFCFQLLYLTLSKVLLMNFVRQTGHEIILS